MLPCPMPCCRVVIGPKEKTIDKNQKERLVTHLTGKGDSEWFGHKGHGIDEKIANEIAEKAYEIAVLVEKVV